MLVASFLSTLLGGGGAFGAATASGTTAGFGAGAGVGLAAGFEFGLAGTLAVTRVFGGETRPLAKLRFAF